jgi:hypothetical protein
MSRHSHSCCHEFDHLFYCKNTSDCAHVRETNRPAPCAASGAHVHVLGCCPVLSLLPLQTSYILAVNSGILSDTGGTCTDADCTVGPLLTWQLQLSLRAALLLSGRIDSGSVVLDCCYWLSNNADGPVSHMQRQVAVLQTQYILHICTAGLLGFASTAARPRVCKHCSKARAAQHVNRCT